MSNYIKKYDVGEIALDLPYNSFIHELPLLSFRDFRNSVNISLIHNHKLKIDESNLFNVGIGYKLNIQKKIIIENTVPTKFIESNGKYVDLISNSNSVDSTVSNGLYTFNDESKRILRVLSDGFEIENYDFSKELYNSLGNITCIYDKYGDPYLTYTYDSNNKLTKVSYNNKEVLFGYYNNNLSSISYGGTTTTLDYNNLNMTIIHYSGVKYNITVRDAEYTVVGEENSGSGNFSKSKVCEYSGYTIILKNIVGQDTIDEVTYRFPSLVTSGYQSYSQVEITSKGVQQRVQYYNDKLLYSYELENDYSSGEVQFYYGECVCDINVHKTLNEDFTNSFSGKIKPHDGTRMYKPLELENKFEIYFNRDSNNNYKFNFLLTGWMRSTNSDNTISIQNSNSEEICHFNVPVSEQNKWHFFAYQFETDTDYIQVIAPNENVSIADLRIICQVTHIIDDDVSHAVYKEDILINQATEEVYTFTQGDFHYKTEDDETGIIEVSISDLIKYLMRNIKNDGMNEITYNDGKNVINNISSVTFILNNSLEEIDVLDYRMGYRYYTEDDEYDTYYNRVDYDIAKFFATNRKNKTPYSRQFLNVYSDVVKLVEDFSTTYTRDKGLLMEEKVENLYHISYTYNTDNTIEITDEYSSPVKKQKYYFDPVWGTVYKKEIDNQVVQEDTYDDDKSTLLKKKFTNIEHLYGYDDGNLSSLSCGDLVYNFEYDQDKLSLVKKFNSTVEEQAHTDFSSTVYYPSQTNMIFSKQYNFDKYGRLISMPNELENIYCFYRPDNPYGSDEIDEINNGESKLVTSEDKLKNRTSYYSYSKK